jgi:hypothetical protein
MKTSRYLSLHFQHQNMPKYIQISPNSVQFDIHRKQLKAGSLEQRKFRIKVNQFIFARQRVAISRQLQMSKLDLYN